MKVKVDQKKCIGCGACVAICDKVFEITEVNGEQKAKVKKVETDEECAKQAESSCPVNAIKVE